MNNLKSYLKDYEKGRLIAVFPHFDDFCFVAGGLAQITNEFNIELVLVSIVSDSLKVGLNFSDQKHELEGSCKILGVDRQHFIEKNNGKWVSDLGTFIMKTKPFAVLTFDPGGITGHPEHSETSISVLNLLKNLKGKRPQLLWRIADKEERKFFGSSKYFNFIKDPHLSYNLSLGQSARKIRAILKHKSKFKSFAFKLRILEWYLFDHKELYYRVDFGSDNFKLKIESS